ncbi:beta-galactosidase GalB [Echinicola shivajiensis]|uniref:beta-galactosidase GalB n=1 Tax=Echinicola shivajiensis TaxID=1035916 RepID=UPI001BFCD212|nr:beta-galactosidase GalB [Echinicola shivajiensis]
MAIRTIYKPFLGVLLVMLMLACSTSTRKQRKILDFNKGWYFKLGDHPNALNADFNVSSWRQVTLPHDWSIEGDFSESHSTTTAGGALPAGKGWYRKSFLLSKEAAEQSIWIEFDGVYRNSEVWINGHRLGQRPNGYSSFKYDLSRYLNFGDEANIIAVKVDNSDQPNSRWYTGSGIYRNVRLVRTEKIHIDHWGLFVSTSQVSEVQAKVDLEVIIKNEGLVQRHVTLETRILNNEGLEVARQSTKKTVKGNQRAEIVQEIRVENPQLWSTENPYLYKVETKVYAGMQLMDDLTTPLGIRYFEFDPEEGFSLNGQPLKIKGVANHHDLGALGAAVNKRAIERQLKILKEMGVNAIRTAHNPPAPELLDLCDQMGFLVQDEAFDVWKEEKLESDGHAFWEQWHRKDLEDMVLRDRNHPSVIMWSIGNEIPEQYDSTGISIANELAGIIKELDMTRPITSALNENRPGKNFVIQSASLDVLGFNYRHRDYVNLDNWYPMMNMIASEGMSALATRGHYEMPSDKIVKMQSIKKDSLEAGTSMYAISAYDHKSAEWGSTHEETLRALKGKDYISGIFVWTGFDYLGEPTPYPYPARSSYFGIVDLAGFPKDAYYLYQSEWTDQPVLHLFPHWNWEEGEKVDVWAYYSQADEVELFLNGESLGIKNKEGDAMHVMWRVDFEPGSLRLVSRRNGEQVLERQVHTAGEPDKLLLIPDRRVLTADGKDLSFVTVSVVDKKGVLVPNADNLINFRVTGEGKIAGVDNGYQASLEPFKAERRKAFNGKCLLIVQSNENKGEIVLRASSDGLRAAQTSLTVE